MWRVYIVCQMSRNHVRRSCHFIFLATVTKQITVLVFKWGRGATATSNTPRLPKAPGCQLVKLAWHSEIAFHYTVLKRARLRHGRRVSRVSVGRSGVRITSHIIWECPGLQKEKLNTINQTSVQLLGGGSSEMVKSRRAGLRGSQANT